MIKLALSLTVFNKDYEHKLLKYVIPSVVKNFNQKDFNIHLFIHFENEKILIDILKIFNNKKITLKIYPHKMNKNELNNFNYISLTKNQISDFNKSAKINCDFIIFLYADMFYGLNSIKNSIKTLLKDKSKLGCCTFGIELEENKYFEKFYKLLIDKNNFIEGYDFFLNNLVNIISLFHKNYIINIGLPTNYNFLIFHKVNKIILLKSFDYHPMILRVQKNIQFFKNEAIDSNFIKKNNIENWYIERDLTKVSCFSISNNSLKRNEYRNYTNLNISKNKLEDIFYKNIFYKLYNSSLTNNQFNKNYLFVVNSTFKVDHVEMNKIINSKICKDGIKNKFINLFIIIKLILSFNLIIKLLKLTILGKKKYLETSHNFYKDCKLILLKSLTTLVFNFILKK